MPAPVASGWSGCRVGLAPTGKRRLVTAHTLSGHSPASFDDLVGAGEDRWRNGKAERLCGLEIDHQLEGCRPLHRKISRLGALEDLSDISADQVPIAGVARSIADQAASRDRLTPLIDRRNGMMRRQRQELVEPVGEERVTADDEPTGMLWDERRESGVTLAFGAAHQDRELYPLRARRFLHVSNDALGNRVVRVHQ